MIVPIYITIVVLAAIASHTGLRYRGRGNEWARAVALVYNAFAMLAFAVLGLASLNIEIVAGVGPDPVVAVEQPYLSILWFLGALGNLVLVLAGIGQELEVDGIPLISSRNS